MEILFRWKCSEGSFKVSSFKVSSFKVSSFKVSSFKVSSFKVSSFKVSSFKVSSFMDSGIQDGTNRLLWKRLSDFETCHLLLTNKNPPGEARRAGMLAGAG
jgi:hypothetical protein